MQPNPTREACKQLPHPDAAELSLPAVLAALSDPIRLRIVRRLAAAPGEHGWSEFALPVCKSTLSHHVKVLREAGIIRHRKDGTRCWLASNPCLAEAFPGLLDAILAGMLAHPRVINAASPGCRGGVRPSRRVRVRAARG